MAAVESGSTWSRNEGSVAMTLAKDLPIGLAHGFANGWIRHASLEPLGRRVLPPPPPSLLLPMPTPSYPSQIPPAAHVAPHPKDCSPPQSPCVSGTATHGASTSASAQMAVASTPSNDSQGARHHHCVDDRHATGSAPPCPMDCVEESSQHARAVAPEDGQPDMFRPQSVGGRHATASTPPSPARSVEESLSCSRTQTFLQPVAAGLGDCTECKSMCEPGQHGHGVCLERLSSPERGLVVGAGQDSESRSPPPVSSIVEAHSSQKGSPHVLSPDLASLVAALPATQERVQQSFQQEDAPTYLWQSHFSEKSRSQNLEICHCLPGPTWLPTSPEYVDCLWDAAESTRNAFSGKSSTANPRRQMLSSVSPHTHKLAVAAPHNKAPELGGPAEIEVQNMPVHAGGDTVRRSARQHPTQSAPSGCGHDVAAELWGTFAEDDDALVSRVLRPRTNRGAGTSSWVWRKKMHEARARRFGTRGTESDGCNKARSQEPTEEHAGGCDGIRSASCAQDQRQTPDSNHKVPADRQPLQFGRAERESCLGEPDATYKLQSSKPQPNLVPTAADDSGQKEQQDVAPTITYNGQLRRTASLRDHCDHITSSGAGFGELLLPAHERAFAVASLQDVLPPARSARRASTQNVPALPAASVDGSETRLGLASPPRSSLDTPTRSEEVDTNYWEADADAWAVDEDTPTSRPDTFWPWDAALRDSLVRPDGVRSADWSHSVVGAAHRLQVVWQKSQQHGSRQQSAGLASAHVDTVGAGSVSSCTRRSVALGKSSCSKDSDGRMVLGAPLQELRDDRAAFHVPRRDQRATLVQRGGTSPAPVRAVHEEVDEAASRRPQRDGLAHSHADSGQTFEMEEQRLQSLYAAHRQQPTVHPDMPLTAPPLPG